MKNLIKILLLITLVSCNENNASPELADSNQNIEIKENVDSVNTDQVTTKPITSNQKNTAEEKTALELEYQDIDGNTVKLSDYKGKIVIVNFWATWCGPCRKEMPDFVKFKNLYKEHVEILGIDFEDSDIETIKSFIKDFDINYPILLTDVYNPTEFERENSLGLPTTVFFDRDGVQFDKRVGPVHFADLVEITGLGEASP